MKMETVKFEELGLYPQLLRAIKEMGFEEATPIQSQAIPVVMSGVDVIGQAQTGTGKTASFGIPLLMKVDPNNKKNAGNRTFSDKRTGHPECGRNPETCKIYAWDQSASHLWRAGYFPSDQGIKRWGNHHHRNTGACDGSSAPQNHSL